MGDTPSLDKIMKIAGGEVCFADVADQLPETEATVEGTKTADRATDMPPGIAVTPTTGNNVDPHLKRATLTARIARPLLRPSSLPLPQLFKLLTMMFAEPTCSG